LQYVAGWIGLSSGLAGACSAVAASYLADHLKRRIRIIIIIVLCVSLISVISLSCILQGALVLPHQHFNAPG